MARGDAIRAEGRSFVERVFGGDAALALLHFARQVELPAEEIEELLVPTYIPELPATDAWENPLEFCLDRDPKPPGNFLAGIRSPGRDGTFEGTVYQAGAFPIDSSDRDVVWIDGYFITWPSKDAE